MSDATNPATTNPATTNPATTYPTTTNPTTDPGADGTPGAGSASTVPPPTVWPTIRARDARALIAFLVDAFGFEETAVFGDGERVDHAQLSWPPGGGVMLGSAREPGPADEFPVLPGTGGCYVVTDDVAGLHARALAAGATPLYGPRDTDYGSREVAFADPEGNLWSFGTYHGEPRIA